MKLKVLLVLSFFPLLSFAQQDEYMLWTETGIEQKIVKRTHYNFEINSRFDRYGLATFFPQLGIDYKVTKWFKPSVEYRFIIDRNKYGNYKASNRINFNADFDYSIDRLKAGARIRYQYAFDRLGGTATYNPDFDMAIRFKPSLEYDINDFILTPKVSAEFFYNPQYGGPYMPGFSKIRYAAGFDLDIKGPHSLGAKYQLDQKLHDYSAGLRHVLSISYSYKIKL